MRQERIFVLLGLLAVSLLLAAGCTTPAPPVTPTPTMTMTSPPTTVPPTTAPVTTAPTNAPVTTAPVTTETTGPQPTPTMTPPGAVTIGLVAKGFAFNTSVITVPACSNVTINFENQDSGVPHNFALFMEHDSASPLFRGQIITGPSSITYIFTAPCTPGDYHFHCDPHRNTMFGTFRVV
jgi:plastocyanin